MQRRTEARRASAMAFARCLACVSVSGSQDGPRPDGAGPVPHRSDAVGSVHLRADDVRSVQRGHTKRAEQSDGGQGRPTEAIQRRADSDYHELEIVATPHLLICEGARDPLNKLTKSSSDQTGCQIWAAALVLARWISTDPTLRELIDGSLVVELGAGCGVPGLAAAVYAHARRVVLTDLNALTVANLSANAAANRPSCSAWCGIEVRVLDWATPPECRAAIGEPVQVLLGSDLAYSADGVRLLGGIVRTLLPRGGVFLHVSAPVRFDLAREFLRDGTFALEAQIESDGGSFSTMRCCRHQAATRADATAQAAQATRCGQEFNEIRTRTFIMQRFRRL